MNAQAHAVFHGRVQGVFFRANTQRKAREAGVTGWVKNLPDGSVEALFEGERERIEEVIDWCSRHQPHARVSKTDVTWEPFSGAYREFSVTC